MLYKPFSNHLLPRKLCEQLLVDKQYFEEAIRTFVRKLHLNFDNVSTFDQVVFRFPVLRDNITTVTIGVRERYGGEARMACLSQISSTAALA